MEIIKHHYSHKPWSSRTKTTEIIVHCSATPEGKDYTVYDIQRWHVQRGFNAIGYNFVIYRDGSIHQGRQTCKVGAHCHKHNSVSVGVCYIGGMDEENKHPKDTRTDAQKASLLELLTYLKAKYPDATIYGHRDFAKKACPCYNAKEEYKTL